MQTLVEVAKNVSGWQDLFSSELMQAELRQIDEYMSQHSDRIVVPARADVFKAFNLTPLDKVKVVLIGQDPYPQLIFWQGQEVPRAVGMSFSVRRGDVIPVSLQNVYKELSTDISNFVIPNHGDLTSWAQQGVLLLNTSLTTFAGEPNAHEGLWTGVMELILQHLNKSGRPIWFLLWGNNAKAILRHRLISDTQVLTAAHPSGLSARKGFFGCKHFSQVNKLLTTRGLQPINWILHQPIEKPLFSDRPTLVLNIAPVTRGMLKTSGSVTNTEALNSSNNSLKGSIEMIPHTDYATKVSHSSSEDDISIRSTAATPEPLPTLPVLFP
jgi:uracil-DNA glycosylase